VKDQYHTGAVVLPNACKPWAFGVCVCACMSECMQRLFCHIRIALLSFASKGDQNEGLSCAAFSFQITFRHDLIILQEFLCDC